MRHLSWLIGPALALSAPHRPARGDFDADGFHHSSPGDAVLFGVQSTRQLGPRQFALSVGVGVLDAPLVVVDETGERVAELVDARLATELAAAVGLGPVELVASLPLVVRQSTEAMPEAGLMAGDARGGLGDLRLGARARLQGDPHRGLSTAASLLVTLPTAGDVPLAGHAGLTGQAAGIAQLRTGRTTLAGNLGAVLRRQQGTGNLEVGHAFLYGVGAAVDLPTLPGTSAVAELAGEVGGSRIEELPLEIRGGLRWRHGSGVVLAAGYGRGLLAGHGAPDHRGMFWVGYAPHTGPAAAAPALQRAPGARATPASPDPDGDGLLGTDDGCPQEAEDFDGRDDRDGCPDGDNDGDGLADTADGCINHAEDRDGFADGDGCPDPDNDMDGIADTSDRCPDQLEIINGNADDDGCPDQGKKLVVIGKTRLQIRDMVHFATGKELILPVSAPLLDQLATTLQRNPWIRKLRIEGHTDDVGSAAANLDLSRRRALAVMRALSERGVSSERLHIDALGEQHPLETNRTTLGRASNRRVEFHIVEQDEHRPAPEGEER